MKAFLQHPLREARQAGNITLKCAGHKIPMKKLGICNEIAEITDLATSTAVYKIATNRLTLYIVRQKQT